MTEQQAKDKLQAEGFSNINVVSFEPNHHHPEHTHDQHTLQIITRGELTVTNKDGSVKTYKTSSRLESPTGTIHSAAAGPEGCTFVAGVKQS